MRAKLIVVDPRRNATADKASLFMQIKPGTDLALLNGLLYLLHQNGHTDAGFIAESTEGWDTMPAFLEDYSPDKVADITGIPEADIRRAAQWMGEAPEWMSCWTMGLNQSTHGTWNTNAICNLHLATGKICRPGIVRRDVDEADERPLSPRRLKIGRRDLLPGGPAIAG